MSGAKEAELRGPPIWHSSSLSYDDWKFEVELWNEWTQAPKNRRGRMVMVALPMDDPSGARDKLRLAIQNNEVDINSDDGVTLC